MAKFIHYTRNRRQRCFDIGVPALDIRSLRRGLVSADLGRSLRERFGGDVRALADVIDLIPSYHPKLERGTCIFLPRVIRFGVAVVMIPTVVSTEAQDEMLAEGVALHLATAVGDEPLHYVDGKALFDPILAAQAHLFAMAFLGREVPPEPAE